LSFTAEEAWQVFAPGASVSIFTETFWGFPAAGDEALLAKWSRIREIRDVVNKEIETVRAAGQVGASLQATVRITAGPEDHALLASLGEDLKFVLITSAATVVEGSELAVQVTPSSAPKCERCWHYRDDVGIDTEHPTLCARCVSNLFGTGESRKVA
jgi:isoleucyl-tRNA synthetase